MDEYLVTERPQRAPSHPGVLIREILEDHLRLLVADVARRIGVIRQSLHAVLSGTTAVSPEMALRLGKLFGRNPDLWLRMAEGRIATLCLMVGGLTLYLLDTVALIRINLPCKGVIVIE